MIWSRHSLPSFRRIDPARDHRSGRSRTFVSALSERRLEPLDDQAQVTRVGFEPNLTGVRDQRPHQKSNEPILSLSRLRKAISAGAGIDPDRPPDPRLTGARSLGFSRPLKTQAGKTQARNEHRPGVQWTPGLRKAFAVSTDVNQIPHHIHAGPIVDHSSKPCGPACPDPEPDRSSARR